MVLIIRAYERKISYPLSIYYFSFSFSFVYATDVKQEDLKSHYLFMIKVSQWRIRRK
jgi:hypothetical protein